MENFKLAVRLASVVSILWSVAQYANGETQLMEVLCSTVIQYVILRVMGIMK